MLRQLTPDQQHDLLRLLAVSAETESLGEQGTIDRDDATLVAQAGLLSASFCDRYPPEHPASAYARDILTWAVTALFTPAFWRFGRALMERAVALPALEDTQRSALEQLRKQNAFATPGDELGTVDDVLSRPVRRLMITRSDGEPPGAAGVVVYQYVVVALAKGQPRIQLAEQALRDTHGLGVGSLTVGDSELIYDFAVNEDERSPATIAALVQAASLAATLGRRFRSQLEAGT